jgi:uncharacterized membrane protein YbhN (UPF0104 family)
LPPTLLQSARAIAFAVLIGAALMVLFSWRQARLLRWAHAILRHVPALDRPQIYAMLAHLLEGFAVLRSRQAPVLLLLTVLAWAGILALAGSVALALHLVVSPIALVFTLVVTTLAMLIPSSPGYIGVFHYWAQQALMQFGVASEPAAAFAVLWHTTNYLTLCVVGVVALWRHGTSLRQLLRRRGATR